MSVGVWFMVVEGGCGFEGISLALRGIIEALDCVSLGGADWGSRAVRMIMRIMKVVRSDLFRFSFCLSFVVAWVKV